MNMSKMFKCGVAGVLLMVFLVVPAQAASEVFVHFVVVPSKTKDGGDIHKALDDLKLFFAEQAGGYTHLGPTDGGYLPPGGTLSKSANYSFIVAAPRDISPEIEAYIPQHFDTEKPYILIWKAVSNY